MLRLKPCLTACQMLKSLTHSQEPESVLRQDRLLLLVKIESVSIMHKHYKIMQGYRLSLNEAAKKASYIGAGIVLSLCDKAL